MPYLQFHRPGCTVVVADLRLGVPTVRSTEFTAAATTARVGHATDIKPHLLGPGPCLSVHWMLFLFCLFALSACACGSEVTVTSYSPPPSVSLPRCV